MNYPVRRVRRSRRRSRRRRIRRGATVLVVLLSLGFSALLISSRYPYLLPRFSPATNSTSDWAQGNASQNLAVLAGEVARPEPALQAGRLIFPYSVVPGGVRTPEELRQIAAHDRVVARHYSDFDFQQARIIELKESRLAYLSYRIGNQIFWTRKQIVLRLGEKLISDGKIMARTRCANRVSALPQKMVSPEEPLAEVFEQPIADGGSAAHLAFPGNFESALMSRSGPTGFGPMGPGGGSLFGPSSGEGSPGIFSPTIPSGSCEPVKKKPKPGEVDLALDDDKSGKKKKKPCHSGPPGTVPEPATIVLFTSGLAGVYLRYRKTAQK